jgi:hypothetical protein
LHLPPDTAQLLPVCRTHINPAETDRACVGAQEAKQETRERGLPAAGFADDAKRVAATHLE